MYLIDTNVLSEIRKIQSSHTPPEFLAWFNAINLNDCYLSVITLLEIEQGILRVRHRGDEAQFLRLQHWLNDTVIPTFDQRILPIDRNQENRHEPFCPAAPISRPRRLYPCRPAHPPNHDH